MTRPLISKPLVWFYAFITVAVAFIVLFNLLAALAFHYPYLRNDDWNLYTDYLELGVSGFLLNQYFGHALTLPKLIFLGNITLFPGTNLPPLLISAGMNAVPALILALMLWRYRSTETPTILAVAACALIVGMVFWMCRHLELTWPIMVGNPLVIGFATIAAWALFRHLQSTQPGPVFDRWLGLAAIVSVLGSFTFGAGIAIWPGIAAAMVIYRLPWTRIAIFLGIGLTAFVLHALMPSQISIELSQALAALPSPWQAISYFFTFLGTAITFSLFPFDGVRTGIPALAAIVAFAGLLILAIYSWRLLRASRPPHPVIAIPLALAWFAVFAAAMSTIGRAGSEIFGHANDYRYTGWSATFWIALVWLALYHLLQHGNENRRNYVLAPLTVILMILFSGATFHGVTHLLDAHYKHRLGGLSMIIAPAIRIDDFRYISPSFTEQRLEILPSLRANQHNPFDETWTHHIGRSLSAHYREDQTDGCTGFWHRIDQRSGARSEVYEGWTTSPQGGFKTLLLVSGDTIIGGARPTWLGDPRRFDRALPGSGVYLASTLLGNKPGWLGVTNNRFAQADEALRVYGLLDENTVCQLREG